MSSDDVGFAILGLGLMLLLVPAALSDRRLVPPSLLFASLPFQALWYGVAGDSGAATFYIPLVGVPLGAMVAAWIVERRIGSDATRRDG